jgi:hypothetical protein
MRLKIPLIIAINFAVIFGMLHYYLNQLTEITNIVFTDNITLNIIIWAAVGYLIGFLISLLPSTKKEDKHRHHLPQKVSTKLILIPSVLLILLLGVSVLYFAGFGPFEIAGHTTGETEEEIVVEENTTTEEVIEETIEESVEEIDWEGVCEEKGETVEVTHPEGGKYDVVEWDELDYGCNIKRDCIQQMDSNDEKFDTDEIRCNIE